MATFPNAGIRSAHGAGANPPKPGTPPPGHAPSPGSPGPSPGTAKAGWYVVTTTTAAIPTGRGTVPGTRTFSVQWLSSAEGAKGIAAGTAVGPYPSQKAAVSAQHDAQNAGSGWWHTLIHDLDVARHAASSAADRVAHDTNPVNWLTSATGGILAGALEKGFVQILKDLWNVIGPPLAILAGGLLIIVAFAVFFKDDIAALAGVAGRVAAVAAA
jgi:hypothetical protein